ncbi:thaumatin family protein [Streptomyces indonesiensis]
MRRILISLATAALVVLAALLPTAGTSAATSVAMPTRDAPVAVKATLAANHTVTFVNHTGRKAWIGSAVNADGSRQFAELPILEPGQSASVTIPENADPGHWRGKFFARLGCTGTSGSTFHCKVGDCGKFADRCELGEQPVSLAEFNFDTRDTLAPWYNVSYVSAFSNPITIAPNNPAATEAAAPRAAHRTCCRSARPPTSPAGRTAHRCCAPTPTGTSGRRTATRSPPGAPRRTPTPSRTRSPATR